MQIEYYLVMGFQILKYVLIILGLIGCFAFSIWYVFDYLAPLRYPWEQEDRRKEQEQRRQNGRR